MTIAALLIGTALAQTLPPDEPLREIRTPNFVLIYPASAEAEAQRAASALDAVVDPIADGLGEHPPRVPVVLNDQLTLSNGYVTLAPRRSGWWTVPLMDSDPQVFGTTLPWIEALAVHEYRHVVQLQHARVGLTRLAYGLFGETGWLLCSGISIPPWFLEGDAVVTETALTEGGRGRTPGFLLDLRTQLLAGRIPTLSQAVAGSFRQHQPDYYRLGYVMVSYGESHFDPALWGRVMERAARFPLLPFAFSHALERETGLNLPDLHRLAMSELQRGWKAQAEARGPALRPKPIQDLPARDAWAKTTSPQPQPDGSVIAYRAGDEDAGSILQIQPDGRARILARTGLRADERIAAAGGRVIWTETRFHPRWSEASWSVLRRLDLATGEVSDLTHRTRLFSPTLSPDGARVAAVEVARDGAESLVVLDAATGQEQRRYPVPAGELVRSPRWALDADALVAVRARLPDGVALGRLDLDSGAWAQISPFQQQVLSDPVEGGGRVYYVSGEAGAEDPWALDLATGQRTRLGSAENGAYSPALRPDGRSLVYADASERGQRLVELPLDPLPAAAGPGAPLPTDAWLQAAIQADQTPPGGVYAHLEEPAWPSEPHSRLGHAINPHSWSPLIDTGGDLGATVISQDVTGSLSAALSAWWRAGELAGGGAMSASWDASPVAVDLSVALGTRGVGALTSESLDGFERESWRETALSGGLRLPLQGGRGPWLWSASLGASASVARYSDIEFYNGDAAISGAPSAAGTLLYASANAGFSRQVMSAARELEPRWSQSLSFSLDRTLPGSDASATRASGELSLGLPAALPLHRLRLGAGAELQSGARYTFSSAGTYPRGYSFAQHDLVAVGRLDYALPLMYPDLNLGGWLYFKRLRADLYYDHGLALDGDTTSPLRSAGLELIADTSFLRLTNTLGVGLRASWLFDAGQPAFEPVLGGSF